MKNCQIFSQIVCVFRYHSAFHGIDSRKMTIVFKNALIYVSSKKIELFATRIIQYPCGWQFQIAFIGFRPKLELILKQKKWRQKAGNRADNYIPSRQLPDSIFF